MPLAKDAAMAVRELVRAYLDAGGRGARRVFADRVGVREQTVSKWLSGENEIPQWRWLEVEKALGLEPLDLANAAGMKLDIPGDDIERTWKQLYPPPNHLLDHLEAVDRAMKEGRPIPRRLASLDEAARVDDLERRLEAVEAHVRRLEALVAEAVSLRAAEQ